MSNHREELIKKLRKVKALAERGSAGERDNAAAIIDRALRENNLTLADLEGEQEREFHCRAISKQETKLFAQCMAKVFRTRDAWPELYGRRKVKGYYFTTAVSKGVEVTVLYTVMRQALKQHLGDAFNAFIMANDLYGEGSGSINELSRKEREAFERSLKLAHATQRTQVNAQLAYGGR